MYLEMWGLHQYIIPELRGSNIEWGFNECGVIFSPKPPPALFSDMILNQYDLTKWVKPHWL